MSDIFNELCTLINLPQCEVLQFIIHWILNNTEFVGVQQNGVTYKELSNAWSKATNTEENNTHECTGYFECNANIQHIECDPHAKWLWNYSLNSNYQYDKDSGIVYPESKQVWSCLNTHLNEIFIFGTITLINKDGVNPDHRGSDHCLISLPFDKELVLINPTFDQFVIALYRLKSHKFDTWYELYIKSIVTAQANGYECELTYDHGS